jgi:ubiquinone biosynthesis protein
VISALFHILRSVRIGWVLAREGAFGLVDPALAPPAARIGLRIARLFERPGVADRGRRLTAAMTRLGPSYVKFGQFLATRPDVVGVAIARDLESLQDRMPPFPRQTAVATIEAALGKPVGDVFARFGEPVAAASIAQVHRGRRFGAEADLAVKVLRPGVERRFKSDLQTMRFIARMAERLAPASRRLRPTAVVETLARSVAIEMDLRLEAAALSEMAQNTSADPDFRVPAVDWELTAKDVLALEWIEGIPLSDIARIKAAGHDRKRLARSLIQSFLRHALRDGFFHADMHQGNLFVDDSGHLCAVDFGIMGRLGRKERRFLAEILFGFITRDYTRVAEVHFEAGYVPRRHAVADFAQAIRAIGEPIHNRRADEISMAKLLALLFEVTGLFDMETRTELVMLQKTMVVVEGVARTLDPQLDMWKTSEPVVREWIERHLGPLGRVEEVGRGLASVVDAAQRLPDLVTRAERVVERLDTAGAGGEAGAAGDAQARANQAIARAIWAVAAVLGAYLLMKGVGR